MFINPEFSKLNVNLFADNFDKIRKDYLQFKDYDYFIDYSHEYDLTAANDDFLGFVPTLTQEYPWKVCPLIFNRKIIKRTPKQCQECFTTELLLNQTSTPVLAVFSILEPEVELEPHSDGDERIDPRYINSSVIKYHFSLDIPEDAESGLVVNNEIRTLSNGDLNLFDEHNIHYAYNRSKKRRGVLIASYIKDEVLNS